MPIYPAMGTGPISFVDGNQSQQELPLSSVFFYTSGPDASSWPNFTSNAATITMLLAQMVSQKYLAPGTQSFSMTVTAAVAGAIGDSIQVAFAPSATAGKVDVTVTATEVYSGLTPTTIGGVLGIVQGSATGLVYLSAAGDGSMPVAFPSEGGTGKLGATMEAAISDGTTAGGAFTVAATNQADTADAEIITVTVAPASGTTPASFTLTASWTKTQTGITLSSLLTTNPFAYVVSFAGQPVPLIAAGTVTLSGGADAVPAQGTTPAVNAVPASANIFAAS